MPFLNPHYIEQYVEIYKHDASYGTSNRFALEVTSHAWQLGARTLLDYGCGKAELSRAITEIPKVFSYDPAIESFNKLPDQIVDLVACIDVMEHIPTLDIDDVLNHIKALGRFAFFHIHTGKVMHYLPNGENAHPTLESKEWWLEKIQRIFPEANIIKTNPCSFNLVTWPTTYLSEGRRLLFKAQRRVSRFHSSLFNGGFLSPET